MSRRGADGATIIDGHAIAAAILAETADALAELTRDQGAVPGIRVVMIGEDRGSALYARSILKTAEKVGAGGELISLEEGADPETIRDTLMELSADDSVGGVIVQLPLPGDLEVPGVIDALDPLKDLDGIHPLNAGLVARGGDGFAPSCAEAALQILKRSGIPIAGRPAVVVGRSNVVGKPAQLLLMREHATVTVCHRQTRDLAAQIRRAEIVVVAAGSPGLVRGEAISEGAVVIDCGINVLEDDRVVGDVVLSSVLPVASVVTPVPGGVGPVTNAVLVSHLARALRKQALRTGRSAVALSS